RGAGGRTSVGSGGAVASGAAPLLARAASATGRGAVVAGRSMVSDVGHGVTLDSGTVSVTRAGDALAASARGSGSEVAGTGRVTLEASFQSVRIGADTPPCAMQP